MNMLGHGHNITLLRPLYEVCVEEELGLYMTEVQLLGCIVTRMERFWRKAL